MIIGGGAAGLSAAIAAARLGVGRHASRGRRSRGQEDPGERQRALQPHEPRPYRRRPTTIPISSSRFSARIPARPFAPSSATMGLLTSRRRRGSRVPRDERGRLRPRRAAVGVRAPGRGRAMRLRGRACLGGTRLRRLRGVLARRGDGSRGSRDRHDRRRWCAPGGPGTRDGRDASPCSGPSGRKPSLSADSPVCA